MITKSEALYFHKKSPNGLSGEELKYIQDKIEKLEFDYNISLKVNYVGVGALQILIVTKVNDYDFKKTYHSYKKTGLVIMVMKDNVLEVKNKIGFLLEMLVYEESEESFDKQSARFNYHIQYANRPQILKNTVFLEKIFQKYKSEDDILDSDIILKLENVS